MHAEHMDSAMILTLFVTYTYSSFSHYIINKDLYTVFDFFCLTQIL
jgi:hypothetical protein